MFPSPFVRFGICLEEGLTSGSMSTSIVSTPRGCLYARRGRFLMKIGTTPGERLRQPLVGILYVFPFTILCLFQSFATVRMLCFNNPLPKHLSSLLPFADLLRLDFFTFCRTYMQFAVVWRHLTMVYMWCAAELGSSRSCAQKQRRW